MISGRGCGEAEIDSRPWDFETSLLVIIGLFILWLGAVGRAGWCDWALEIYLGSGKAPSGGSVMTRLAVKSTFGTMARVKGRRTVAL